MVIRILLFIILPLLSFAKPQYFLCGPDEDGCLPDEYPYCLCITYDAEFAQQPYCLDFNTVTCIPYVKKPNCPKMDVFRNESDCVATAYQSEAEPPCPLVSEEFCKSRKIKIM